LILSYSKVNIFLKITNRDNNGYHHLISRFVKYKDLYDTITFNKKIKPNHQFVINGKFDCKIEQNTIYKAYALLYNHTKSNKLKNFFFHHSIDVDKKIPSFAGLGGGSSNCASFLTYTNTILKLGINQTELCNIAKTIGSDVVFFIKDFDSANVYKKGEIVERFDEEIPKIKVFTPNIKCSTKDVFNEYKKSNIPFFTDKEISNKLLHQKSKNILQEYDALFLNDLYSPAENLYPRLKEYTKHNNFFSGSGSSFFTTTY